MTSRPLKKLGFLHIVPFDPSAPRAGLEDALELFSFAEELGLDGGWVRTRHLQFGLPSPAVFLAAAAQRTDRLELGTAVIPTGYENPFRLAEDLAVADLLSGGRLHPGLSVGPPWFFEQVRDALYGDLADAQDFSYARIEKLLAFIRGQKIAELPPIQGIEEFSQRLEPHSPGLASRIRYGGGSLKSAAWAGAQGLGFLVSNITTGDSSDDFATAQRKQIDAFRAAHPDGENAWVAMGHVLVPTDGASDEQRARYGSYVEARTPRTLRPGENRRLIAKDVFGTTEQIVAQLRADAAFQAVDELLFELPFSFTPADYRQILTQLATEVGPALGWKPKE